MDESNIVPTDPKTTSDMTTPNTHPFNHTSSPGGEDSIKIEARPKVASPNKDREKFLTIGIGLVGKY